MNQAILSIISIVFHLTTCLMKSTNYSLFNKLAFFFIVVISIFLLSSICFIRKLPLNGLVIWSESNL